MLHQLDAGRRRAGEGQLAHRRVGAHFAADRQRVAGQHREDAGRDAGTLGRITSYNVCYTKLLREMLERYSTVLGLKA